MKSGKEKKAIKDEKKRTILVNRGKSYNRRCNFTASCIKVIQSKCKMFSHIPFPRQIKRIQRNPIKPRILLPNQINLVSPDLQTQPSRKITENVT